MRRLWLLLLFLAWLDAAPTKLPQLSGAEQAARIQGDLAAVRVYREGLRSVVTFAASRPDLFPGGKLEKARVLRQGEKEAVRAAWKSFLDYLLALDAVSAYHRDFYRLRGEGKEKSFLAGYAAFLAKYRCALEFIERAENDPGMDTLLNEPGPETGLSAGMYARLKFRFLNVGRATAFAAYEVSYKIIGGSQAAETRKGIEEDRKRIWEAGKGRGEILTARNALRIVERSSFTAFFPVQAGVSEWMGDTKVWRRQRSLISAEQIGQLAKRLEPGDILLERREWYLSNIGLPGFWPHTALFLGTPGERRQFFADEETKAWVRLQGEVSGDLEGLLRSRHPRAYAHSVEAQEHGHLPRVLEAMSEGVSFTTLEHSADADSLAAVRPRLSKVEKAAALLRAFQYAGRPYDFNFDFLTDAAIVCSELIYKAYEPAPGLRGLRFPLVEMLGRQVTPPNEMVRQFDAQFGAGEQQTDLVIFLDGHERKKAAIEAPVGVFRQSWKRPKWHIFVAE